MSNVFDQDREVGMVGDPEAELPGGGLAASGQVTMQRVPRAEQEDDGSDTDLLEEESAE